MLVQVGFEVKAAGVLPPGEGGPCLCDKTAGGLPVSGPDPHDRIRGISGERLCTGCGDRDGGPSPAGIPEALRAYNIRYSKKIILDRSAAGIRKKTLIINLPESAKISKEDMEYILPEVVQVVETMSL